MIILAVAKMRPGQIETLKNGKGVEFLSTGSFENDSDHKVGV